MKAKFLAWWEARQPRERVLAVVAALALAIGGIDLLLIEPVRAERKALLAQQRSATQQLDQLRATVGKQFEQGSADLDRQRRDLQARREAAERALAQASSDLVAPQEMPAQLARILDRFPRLRVVGATSLPPVPLVTPGADAKSVPAALAGLYQHGLELQIAGRYLDLLGYLEALERLPQKVYWRELEMKVGADGVPVTKIVVFTLSREATWLRV